MKYGRICNIGENEHTCNGALGSCATRKPDVIPPGRLVVETINEGIDMHRVQIPTVRARGFKRSAALVGAGTLALCAAVASAAPTIQLGNYVVSNLAGGTLTIPVFVSDPSVIDAASQTAEDIEGIGFTVQIGTGTGSSPSISSIDLTTNTVWSGKTSDAPVQVSNLPQFQVYSLFTSATDVTINPNGKLATVVINGVGAPVGTVALKLVGTGSTATDTQFSDGLGNLVSANIGNGTLTVTNNPIVYWTGSSSANWDTGGNWSSTAKPTASQDAYFGAPIPATGAALTLATNPEAVNNLWFDGSYTFNGSQLNLSGGTVNVFTGSTATVNSVIGGSAGLKLTGGGNLTLGGASANVYTGNTTVNAGTLTLSKSSGVAIAGGNLQVTGPGAVAFTAPVQTGDQTAVTLTNTGNLTASLTLGATSSQTVGSLAGNGTVAFPVLAGPSLSVGANGTPTNFSGAITGAGNLIKTGAGTLTVSGSNLSLPTVTVNGGTLAFSTVAPNLTGSTLAGNWTVNGATLTLPNGAAVTTIAPAGIVTLGAPTASFPALSGLTANKGSFTVSGGKSFTTSGGLTNDGTVNVGGVGGALAVAGDLGNTGTPAATGTTSVGAGAALTAKSFHQNSVTVAGSLNIQSKAAGGAASLTNSLNIAGTPAVPTGKLDLADNSLIVAYTPGNSPASTISSQLKAGFGTGNWGGNGITSGKAAADPTHFALGFADAINGATVGQVVVKYTRAGDANLDGKVDVSDLGILASNYGKVSTWATGDFNYSSKTDVTDLGILATNYGFGTSLTAAEASLEFRHDLAEFPQLGAVPEPASAGLLAVGSLLLLARRRGHGDYRA